MHGDAKEDANMIERGVHEHEAHMRSTKVSTKPSCILATEWRARRVAII